MNGGNAPKAEAPLARLRDAKQSSPLQCRQPSVPAPPAAGERLWPRPKSYGASSN